jgi:hypothetical protein
VTFDEESTLHHNGREIGVVPLWKWMLL